MRTKVLLCIPMVLMLAAEASGQCRVEGVARSADGTPMGGATVRLEGSESTAGLPPQSRMRMDATCSRT